MGPPTLDHPVLVGRSLPSDPGRQHPVHMSEGDRGPDASHASEGAGFLDVAGCGFLGFRDGLIVAADVDLGLGSFSRFVGAAGQADHRPWAVSR